MKFKIRLGIALLLLTFQFSALHAQSLVNPVPLEDTTFDYRVLPYEATVSGFTAQANAEGATRFLFGGNYVYSGSTVSIYGRPVATNTTAVYSSFPRPVSAAALVTVLNTQGASGNLYLGDYSISDSLLVKYSGPSTYTYRQFPLAATEPEFVTQITAQGAEGYAFLGNVGFSTTSGFAFSSLYVRNNANNDVFTYETRNIAQDVNAFLTLARSQGLRGFRYQGDLIFTSPTTVSKSFFVRNSARTDRFFYEALSVANTAASFLTQANALGARKYLFYGNVGVGTPTEFASIYISLSDLILANGFE